MNNTPIQNLILSLIKTLEKSEDDSPRHKGYNKALYDLIKVLDELYLQQEKEFLNQVWDDSRFFGFIDGMSKERHKTEKLEPEIMFKDYYDKMFKSKTPDKS